MKLHRTEHQIQNSILEWANYLGIRLWRFNSGMLAIGEGKSRRMVRLGTAGMPDLIGYFTNRFANGKFTGMFLGIEVKAGKNKPTDAQERTLSEMKKDGAIAFVAYSVDDVESYLKNLEKQLSYA